jgi:GAF domain-containing protein/HAMP domain-containing protein
MDNQMLQHFFELPAKRPDLPPEKRGAYQLLSTAVTFISVFQSLTGVSILVIGMLALAGYFDIPENISLLFIVASINILDSLLHLPMFPLLRQGKLELVAILLTLVNGILSAMQILLWQGVIWFPIAMVLSAVIVLVSVRGIHTRTKIAIGAIGAALLVAVLFANSQIDYPRLSLSNFNNIAAFVIYLLLTATMLAIGVMNGMVNFQTLSRRLVITFTTATVIAIIIFITIGTFTNYLDSRNRAFEQIETISNLKASQVNLVLERLQRQAAQPLSDSSIYRISLMLLSDNIDSSMNKINGDQVRSYLTRIQGQAPEEEYLLVNADGRIVLSTNRNNEKLDVSTLPFMEAARQNIPFSIEKDFPGTQNQYSILVLKPLVAQNRFVGVLVFRSDFSVITEVIGIAPGTSQTLETYLVSQVEGVTVPTTTIRKAANEVDTYPVQQVFGLESARGSGTYPNYAGVEVFGHYIWIPELRSVLISEIEQQEVLASITRSLPIYLSIGAIMVLLVFVTVLITSPNISLPIQDFARKAAALAGGELSIRITSDRQDELGALATSFNKMAGELETLVRTLETKVQERTQNLQKQANYLRIAAEVARDATTSQDLDELLNRAAQLIMDRFNFYHTGIFLVDPDREYAVLRASPTEAGRKMLQQRHRLRLGQVGLVGFVAATGTPRIALDTGQDVAHFRNPLLPDTRSEVAIPLKLDDRVLGVLDVQSTQPEAFTQDDVATLQVMADQLALAIQRVELVSNLQRNLEELESTYKAFTGESWQKFSQQRDFKPGYLFDGFKLTPLESFPTKIQNALSRGRTTVLPPQRELDGATVVTPLKLREQVIGGLTLRFQTPTVDPDTIGLVEETAGRLAIALENARLYEETQNLVERERTVSEISSRITTSFNIENILRTAVMEIGKRMPDAEVVVQLEQNKD